jgi:hypothetical protein
MMEKGKKMVRKKEKNKMKEEKISLKVPHKEKMKRKMMTLQLD